MNGARFSLVDVEQRVEHMLDIVAAVSSGRATSPKASSFLSAIGSIQNRWPPDCRTPARFRQ
jgi:hypothetical protein